MSFGKKVLAVLLVSAFFASCASSTSPSGRHYRSLNKHSVDRSGVQHSPGF